MKTLLRTKGTHTSFIIADLDPAYSEVVQALEYEEMDAGFAKKRSPGVDTRSRSHRSIYNSR